MAFRFQSAVLLPKMVNVINELTIFNQNKECRMDSMPIVFYLKEKNQHNENWNMGNHLYPYGNSDEEFYKLRLEP